MNSLTSVIEQWNMHQSAILAYLLKHSQNESIAQDLTQDVYLKVYNLSLKSDYHVGNLRSWLFQLAHNTLMDYYRRPKTNCLCPEAITAAFVTADINTYSYLADFVQPLLSCLPEVYAKPLSLDLEGIPQKDIAQNLHLDLSTTKSRIQRSRKKMRGLFAECFFLDLDSIGRVESFAVRPDCQVLQNYLAETNYSQLADASF